MAGSTKAAPTDVPLLDAIARRWSPRAFADTPVGDAELRQVLEAARWAASSRNEQPWRFVVVRKGEHGYGTVLGCLNEKNRRWARHAPVLMLVFAQTTFARNGSPNAHAWHDVGAACAQLSVQAAALGLQTHLMGGIDREAIREAFRLPAGVEPVTALALGYAADPSVLPEDLRERETASRARRPVEEWVFGAAWGKPLQGIDG